jgi:hypothetical protein
MAKATAKKSKPGTTPTTKKPAEKRLRTPAPPPGWREVELSDDARITVKVAANPYRGKRADRWTYATGMTVAEAVAKGARRPDVKWDLAKGYIAVSGAPSPKSGHASPAAEAHRAG